LAHSQVLLTGHVQIFQVLFPHLKSSFRREDVESLGKVLLNCVQVPLDTEFENPNCVTPLHGAALEAVETVKEVALEAQNHAIVPELFDVLFKLGKSSLMVSKANGKDLRFREKFSLFGEACMESMALFYEKSCKVNKKVNNM
jgi:hypothetical protein